MYSSVRFLPRPPLSSILSYAVRHRSTTRTAARSSLPNYAVQHPVRRLPLLPSMDKNRYQYTGHCGTACIIAVQHNFRRSPLVSSSGKNRKWLTLRITCSKHLLPPPQRLQPAPRSPGIASKPSQTPLEIEQGSTRGDQRRSQKHKYFTYNIHIIHIIRIHILLNDR